MIPLNLISWPVAIGYFRDWKALPPEARKTVLIRGDVDRRFLYALVLLTTLPPIVVFFL